MTCPKCQAAAPPDANFCEACGAPLKEIPAPPAPGVVLSEPCEGCGAGPELIQEDGFCGRCGLQRRHPERDHFEVEVRPRLGGVSDRGVKHYRNEDFIVASQAEDLLLGVICDGVSNSQNPDAASAAGAGAARDAWLACLAGPTPRGMLDYEAAMKSALERADTAVLSAAGAAGSDDPQGDPPGSTIVAAVVLFSGAAAEVIIGWLGDSRVYFIGPNSERQLTKDHSWLVEVVESGKMTYAEAIRCRGSHAITRTLGGFPARDGSERDEPSIVRCALPDPGWLILCTDGLWNYAPDLPAFAALVRQSAKSPDPLDLARNLVAWARQQGGKDNISVLAIAI